MRNSTCALWFIGLASIALTASPVRALESDELYRGYPRNMKFVHAHGGFVNGDGGGGVLGHRSAGSLLGIDSIPAFSSYFYFPGLNRNGFPQFTWQYTMVGKSPFKQD